LYACEALPCGDARSVECLTAAEACCGARELEYSLNPECFYTAYGNERGTDCPLYDCGCFLCAGG